MKKKKGKGNEAAQESAAHPSREFSAGERKLDRRKDIHCRARSANTVRGKITDRAAAGVTGETRCVVNSRTKKGGNTIVRVVLLRTALYFIQRRNNGRKDRTAHPRMRRRDRSGGFRKFAVCRQSQVPRQKRSDQRPDEGDERSFTRTAPRDGKARERRPFRARGSFFRKRKGASR